MGVPRGLRWFVVLALLASVAAGSSDGAATGSPAGPTGERPATVVVRVDDGGFHWADAGVGAAAAIATALLGLGFVLALRPDRARRGNP